MAIQEKFIQLVNRLFSKVVPSRPVKQEQQNQIKEEKNEPITTTRNENQEEPQTTPTQKVKRRGRKKKE